MSARRMVSVLMQLVGGYVAVTAGMLLLTWLRPPPGCSWRQAAADAYQCSQQARMALTLYWIASMGTALVIPTVADWIIARLRRRNTPAHNEEGR